MTPDAWGEDKTAADSSASLRNDNQKGGQGQGQRRGQGQGQLKQQIPPLRCGMTTRRAGNGEGNGEGEGEGKGKGN